MNSSLMLSLREFVRFELKKVHCNVSIFVVGPLGHGSQCLHHLPPLRPHSCFITTPWTWVEHNDVMQMKRVWQSSGVMHSGLVIKRSWHPSLDLCTGWLWCRGHLARNWGRLPSITQLEPRPSKSQPYRSQIPSTTTEWTRMQILPHLNLEMTVTLNGSLVRGPTADEPRSLICRTH